MNVIISKAMINITKNGMTLLAKRSIGKPETEETAYKQVPTGGVIVPIIELIDMIIPK